MIPDRPKGRRSDLSESPVKQIGLSSPKKSSQNVRKLDDSPSKAPALRRAPTLSSEDSFPMPKLSAVKKSKSGLEALPVVAGECPLTPDQALVKYGKSLHKFEREELVNYNCIYYLGLEAAKQLPFVKNPDGTYPIIKHDQIAYRYEILDKIGEGSFSQVFSAYDHKEKRIFALKAVKNLHRFFEQSQMEIDILKGLAKAYKGGSYSIELLRHFVFRDHRFLVFELMHKNLFMLLRDLKFKGLPQPQVLQISYQLLYALSQIHRRGIIHCDLKPENLLLINPECDRIKLIDFGTACLEKKKAFKYIQSRFYRAPEVILGYSYTNKVDMWSFGCMLVEMITGKPPFRGEDVHQQFLSILEVKEYPPLEFISKAPKRKQYFVTYEEPVLLPDSKGNVKTPCSRPLARILRDQTAFVDLIDKCLEWEPEKRMSALDALNHPIYSRASMANPRKTNPPSSTTSKPKK